MKTLLIAIASFASLSSFADMTSVTCKRDPSTYNTAAATFILSVVKDGHYVASLSQTASRSDSKMKIETVMENLVCSFSKSNPAVFTCFEDIRDTVDETSSVMTTHQMIAGLGEAVVLSFEAINANAEKQVSQITFKLSDCQSRK